MLSPSRWRAGSRHSQTTSSAACAGYQSGSDLNNFLLQAATDASDGAAAELTEVFDSAALLSLIANHGGRGACVCRISHRRWTELTGSR